MADVITYGTIYRLTFFDLFGQSCQLDLEQRWYTGTVNDLTCEHSPIQITFDTPSIDNIFDPINGSRAIIKVVATSDFEFMSWFTSDVRKYRVSLYIETVLQWRGFLQPHQGSSAYKIAPTINTFVAMDQLGYLKTLIWDRENVETELSALGAILNKTGLGLNMYEALNVYEDNHASTAADSPLDQTYFNSKRFDGLTYYDALQQLLFKYKATIRQNLGYWEITRPEDVGTAYTRRLFTFSAGIFTYNSNASHNPVVSTTSTNTTRALLVRVSNESPNIDVAPAWNRYKLIQKFDKIENIFENGDFTEWNGNNPTEWERWNEASMTYIRDGDGVRIQSGAGYNAAFRQKVYLNNQSFRFKAEWDVFVEKGKVLKVYVEINRHVPGQPTSLNWDFDMNAWTYNNARFIGTYDNSSGDAGLWQSDSFEFTTLFSFFTQTDYIEIILYKPVEYLTGGTMNYVRWKYAGAMCGITSSLYDYFVDYFKDYSYEIDLDTNNTKDGGDVEMMLNDVIPGTFMGKVYYGGLWLDAAQLFPTQNWTDSSGSGPLVKLLMNGLSWAHLKPAEILKVSIYSKLVNSTSVIQEINYDNMLFMIKRAVWDVRYGRWTIEGYKIGQGDIPTIDALLAEDGTDLLAENTIPLEIE